MGRIGIRIDLQSDILIEPNFAGYQINIHFIITIIIIIDSNTQLFKKNHFFTAP